MNFEWFMKRDVTDWEYTFLKEDKSLEKQINGLRNYIKNLEECKNGNKDYTDFRVLIKRYSPNMFNVFIPDENGTSIDVTKLLIATFDCTYSSDFQQDAIVAATDASGKEVSWDDIAEGVIDYSARDAVEEVYREHVNNLIESMLIQDATDDVERYENDLLSKKSEHYFVHGCGFSKAQSIVFDLVWIYNHLFPNEIIDKDPKAKYDVEDNKTLYTYIYNKK